VIRIDRLFREHAVHEGNRDRPFSDGGGGAFDVAAADVADREHLQYACFTAATV
jgi:hypothetical protein